MTTEISEELIEKAREAILHAERFGLDRAKHVVEAIAPALIEQGERAMQEGAAKIADASAARFKKQQASGRLQRETALTGKGASELIAAAIRALPTGGKG